MCDLVKKSEGGGSFFFFRDGGSISRGGHVSSFKRGGGALAWGVHWAQSSFKLQRFLCSKGYAMDNLDETQCIHLP